MAEKTPLRIDMCFEVYVRSFKLNSFPHKKESHRFHFTFQTRDMSVPVSGRGQILGGFRVTYGDLTVMFHIPYAILHWLAWDSSPTGT